MHILQTDTWKILQSVGFWLPSQDKKDEQTEEMKTVGTERTCLHLMSFLILTYKNSIQNYLRDKFIFISSSSSPQQNHFCPYCIYPFYQYSLDRKDNNQMKPWRQFDHSCTTVLKTIWKLGRIICLSASPVQLFKDQDMLLNLQTRICYRIRET